MKNLKDLISKFSKISISYPTFVLIYSLIISLLNYRFIKYCISNMDDGILDRLFLPINGFVILTFLFGILFLIPYIRKFLAISLLLISSVCAYFMIYLGVILNRGAIKSALDATAGEASEVINTKLILWILITGILPSIVIFFTKIKNNGLKKEAFIRGGFIIIVGVILSGLWVNFSKEYFAFFRMNKDSRYYPNPFYPISSFVKLMKQEHFSKKMPFIVQGKDAKINDNQKKLLILIIGETARSMNFSANGYTKNLTNPYTKDFISFTDVSSCATFTTQSLPCMFSNLGKKKFSPSKAEHQSNLLDVLSTAGVKIAWVDNDTGCKDVCNRIKDYELNRGRDTDSWTYKKVKKRLDNLKNFKDELIVAHIIGSHGPTYYRRYPKEFRKFSPTCDTSQLEKCTTDEIVNTYDNTILYTDYIINSIKNEVMKFDNNNTKVGVIYISDHGESLGEGGVYLHGLPTSIAPDYQTKVPFMIWVNNKAEMENLAKIKNDKFSHDNLFHTVLGFFGVSTKLYKPDLDVFKEDK